MEIGTELTDLHNHSNHRPQSFQNNYAAYSNNSTFDSSQTYKLWHLLIMPAGHYSIYRKM